MEAGIQAQLWLHTKSKTIVWYLSLLNRMDMFDCVSGAHVSGHTKDCVEVRGQPWCHSSGIVYLGFFFREVISLAWSWTCRLSWLARELQVSAFSALRFICGFYGLNVGPPTACVATTWLLPQLCTCKLCKYISNVQSLQILNIGGNNLIIPHCTKNHNTTLFHINIDN